MILARKVTCNRTCVGLLLRICGFADILALLGGSVNFIVLYEVLGACPPEVR